MCLVDEPPKVTGTLIWYYYICQREVWLMAHELNPEHENLFLELGRLIHEGTYSRDKKEFTFPGMKIDILQRREGRLIIGEVKKSSKTTKSAKMQLAYYLWRLEKMGLQTKGELLIPRERKRISIELTESLRIELEKTIEHIKKIVASKNPPPPVRSRFCRKCAYQEFCWS